MRQPLVDITTLNAVQSLFAQGTQDPWRKELAGRLADLMIYADIVRYSLPVPGDGWRGLDRLQEPSLLVELAGRDSASFRSEEYSTKEPLLLRDEHLETCFESFAAWAKANQPTLSQWIRLHNEPWIRPIQGPRAQHRYVFLLETLRQKPDVKALTKLLGVTEDDVYYAFDVVLRFPLYGQLTGVGEYYLNHPIRDAFQLPTMEKSVDKAPPIAVSFRNVIADLAPKLTQEEYTVLLHELRGQVRDFGLHKVGPGECDKEVIREIAARVSLPPRLKAIGKGAAVMTAFIGGLGAVPALGPAAAIVGAAVSVSTALWDGKLPRGTAQMKWLRWAVEWDVEQQVEARD